MYNLPNTIRTLAVILCIFLMYQNYSIAQVKIEIEPHTLRYIGDVNELDRSKYFSMHDTRKDADTDRIRSEFNITGGRQFWGAYSFANSKTNTVGVYPTPKNGNSAVKNVVSTVSTEHPRNVYKEDIDVDKAAKWAVEYWKNFVDVPNEYIEVMNEPFVHAKDFYTGGFNSARNQKIKMQMSELYGAVGKAIHEEPALKNLKVVGYSSAWPSLELWDFGHWNSNMKMFMDVAGEHMDGFAVHLYDGINVTGKDSKRSGSNAEAILDLIENYSYIKWDLVKPFAITEYGGIEKGFGPNYSRIANSQSIVSQNHILMQLLEREDRLINSIPFNTGKALWHITAANNYQPYTPSLWVPKNIGQPNPKEFEPSSRIYFYDLWKDVKGKRVAITTDNPDIQTQAFVDGNKLYVALSNLHDASLTTSINLKNLNATISELNKKSISVFIDKNPIYVDEKINNTETSFSLIPDETVLLTYTFQEDLTFDGNVREKLYFQKKYLQTISANQKQTYIFDNIQLGKGTAVLKLGIGRKHNKSKSPTILINGTKIDNVDNWKGYDQVGRDDFFGTIEFPFSADLLIKTTKVEVTFPDSEGRVSSVILKTILSNVEPDNSTGQLPIGTRGSFIVKTIDSPCPKASKGKLEISTTLNGSVTGVLQGEGSVRTFQFTSDTTIESLKVGEYTLTLTEAENKDSKEVYKINVDEPESLNVDANQGGRTLDLTLEGADTYYISHNGVTVATTKDNFQIKLNEGDNMIAVSTKANCQGKFSKNFRLKKKLSKLLIYPNPVSSSFQIQLPESLNNSDTKISVKVIAPNGKVWLKSDLNQYQDSVEINTETLPKGIYLISVSGNQQTQIQTQRIIKL